VIFLRARHAIYLLCLRACLLFESSYSRWTSPSEGISLLCILNCPSTVHLIILSHPLYARTPCNNNNIANSFETLSIDCSDSVVVPCLSERADCFCSAASIRSDQSPNPTDLFAAAAAMPASGYLTSLNTRRRHRQIDAPYIASVVSSIVI